MSFETFIQKVSALIARVNDGTTVRFHHDEEKGRYYANCSDGTTIIGNSSALKVTVRFGSGHQAMAAI